MVALTPGIKADATVVREAARGRFESEAKTAVRMRALTALRRMGVERPLDLWGGGKSAELMLAAGMKPLSIDDGRLAGLIGIARPRFLRAMTVSGELAGYETATGTIRKHAALCDGAFLDFCGHWSPSVASAIRSCRHMKGLVVTLMPERTAFGRLSLEEWVVAYSALLSFSSEMTVQRPGVYRRNDNGQHAMVFVLRAGKRVRGKPWFARPENAITRAERAVEWRNKPGVQQHLKEYRREYANRPEVRERRAEYGRAYRALESHRERKNALRRKDGDQLVRFKVSR